MAEKQYRLEEVIQTQHKDKRGRDMGTSVVRLFVPTDAYGAPGKVQLL